MRGDKSKTVVGVFDYHDDLIKAIKAIKETQLEYRVYSPVPTHEIEALTMPPKSPVRTFTLVGGLTGCTFGFSLAILCALDWPLRVSAKDVVSIPGFVVIGYECTILFGALATLLAIFCMCRLPDPLRSLGYDPRFSGSKFGLVVSCGRDDVEDTRSKLLSSGAGEVNIQEGL